MPQGSSRLLLPEDNFCRWFEFLKAFFHRATGMSRTTFLMEKWVSSSVSCEEMEDLIAKGVEPSNEREEIGMEAISRTPPW
ncbi:hypothetical protein Y032_0008g158 [Ancylostoma ceylanicum]|uniref:Uncharacterized protein n=1 Tax=Ancylostoma ceylanicum TaxID=53326 RepID=A0A016VJY5_9BILA|nr:hypothetical protein Y032_0008g158 [Ancylostoma ceylanicum]